MTPEEIRTRCRKVWIITTDNQIFGNEPDDNLSEPRFAPAFRTKEIAVSNITDRQAALTKAYNLDRFGQPKYPHQTLKAVAVYLVPASKIDKP